MPEKSFSHKELVELLGKLKEETPEYPAKLVEARKESFLKHVLDMSASGGGQGGDAGSDGGDEGSKGGSAGSAAVSGAGKTGRPLASDSPSSSGGSSTTTGSSGSGGASRSGTGVGSGTTFLGFSLKSVLAVGAVVVLLTAAYLFREQITEVLTENNVINAEETTEPPLGTSQSAQVTETPPAVNIPEIEDISPASAATATVPGLGSNNNPLFGNRGSSTPTPKLPIQIGGAATVTPTPGPPSGLGGALQYLICILRFGGESCQ